VRHASILLAVFSLGAVGCNWQAKTAPAPVPSPAPAAGATGGSEAYPSKDEVLDYLDEVDQGGTSVGDGPWSTKVTFIAKSGMERYAVKMSVQHRRVENKRAFFVQDIALQ